VELRYVLLEMTDKDGAIHVCAALDVEINIQLYLA